MVFVGDGAEDAAQNIVNVAALRLYYYDTKGEFEIQRTIGTATLAGVLADGRIIAAPVPIVARLNIDILSITRWIESRE